MSTRSPSKGQIDSSKIKVQVQSASPSTSSNSSTRQNRRLLIPTAQELTQARSPPPPVRRTKSSSSGIKLTRLARGDVEDSTSVKQTKVYASQKAWWTALGKLNFVGQTEVEGYHLYAVEKWQVNFISYWQNF